MKKLILPGDPRDMSVMDRRELLKHALGGAVAFTAAGAWAPGALLAQDDAKKYRKFILYVHMGSACGVVSGLIQPRDKGVWQRGLFRTNEDAVSVNPNVNKHFKYKNLVFHDYVKFLERMGDHMCFAVGNARTLSHGAGTVLQATGDGFAGPNPSWVTGVAQALYDGKEAAAMVVNEGYVKLSNETANVALVGGGTLNAFRANFSDAAAIPKGADVDRFWAVLADLHKKQMGVSAVPDMTARSAGTYLNNVVKGIPQLADGNPVVQDVMANITKAKVDATIADVEDKALVMQEGYPSMPGMLGQLQLAAILAKTGVAKGMSIGAPGPDSHEGRTSGNTARLGSLMFAHLAVFWDWVVANGMQDDVLVVVSHEFSRGPYNTQVVKEQVFSNGKEMTIDSPGTDHATAMGMVFINGKVPSAGRIGALHDLYVPTGSSSLTGIANPDIPSWDSTQLVGTMLRRCFDDIFWRDRVVKAYWPNYVESKELSKLILG